MEIPNNMALAVVAATLALATNEHQITSKANCDLAIAGAGPGGIYTAWRYLAAHKDKHVCIFERSARHGGRI